MKDELSGLGVLLAVAERRSFSAAAADLKLSPSAVSQSVSALEERLGVRLLARTTRSVGLTEAGERFVARVGPALAEVKAAALELDELRAAPRGVLRVNSSRIAYERLIEPRLAEFLRAFPEVSLDVVLDEALADIVLVQTALKDITRRVKPARYPTSGWFSSKGPPTSYLRGNGSFPSGHSMAAFSVATIVARQYRNHRWVPYVAYGLASLVGFSRLPLNVHFLSDVVMGGAIGYSISRFTVLRQ